METLFTHNPGLPSRFPVKYEFQDYTDEELYSIFQSHLLYMAPGSTSSSSSEKKKQNENKSPTRSVAPASGGIALDNLKFRARGSLSLPVANATGVGPFGHTWTWDGSVT